MSDTPEASPKAKPAFSPVRLGVTLAVVVAIGVVVYLIGAAQSVQGGDANESDAIRRAMGLGEPVTNRLGAGYADSDGDLVADTPGSEADLLDPGVLTFSFIANAEPGADADLWQPLVDHLAQATGKQVQYVPYTSRSEQLRAVRDGRLHLAGLNTGSVPVAVNACGFVPVCAPGQGGSADAYKMVVIVPADSAAESLKDLSGKRFAFTQPTSNSGCKAALVILAESGLTLGEDYDYAFTHGHAQLMQAIADKEYAAGSTASDLLERAIQQGELDESKVRVIYTSEPFPTAALGMTHRLKPELAEQIAQAMIGFSFIGTPLEQEYAASGADALVPISYKDDFALIRRIDDAVGYDHQRALEAEDAQAKDADE